MCSQHLKITLPNCLLFLLAFLLTFSLSCSSTYTGKANIGTQSFHRPGLPFVTIAASSNIDENGDTQAIIFLSIVENSLIFKRDEDSLASRADITIEIYNPENHMVANETYNMHFKKAGKSNYYEQNNIRRQKTFDIPPGKYNIKVTIIDLNSDKQTTKEKEIEIPNPDEESVFISNIRFYEKQNSHTPYIAINKYNVNAGFDSLKFTFQVTNGLDNIPLNIQSNLIRFNAHDEPARPMSGRNPRSSYLEYIGLDYSDHETVQSNIRTLNSPGSVTIENSFTNLPQGNYRFEVAANSNEGKTYFAIRDFSVKSGNFPLLKTARELAAPLVYLMDKKNHNELLQIKSPDSLKTAIDAYWINNIRNVPKAKTIIELYYERVEQANLQFSNYKEGWKTDPGMVYILFGPPLYVDEGFGEMIWFYEFDSGNRVPSIFFEDTQYGNNKFPFQNFLLRRSPALFSLEYRQLQSWKDGSILFLSQ